MCISAVLINGWVNAIGHLRTMKYFCLLNAFCWYQLSPCLSARFWASRSPPQRLWHNSLQRDGICQLTPHLPKGNVRHVALIYINALRKHEFRPEVSDYSSILRTITKIKSMRFSKAPSRSFCTPIEFKQIRVNSIQAEVLLQRGLFQLGRIQLLFQSLPDKFCSSFSRFRNQYLYSVQ